MRYEASPGLDKKIFRRTASSTKAVNLGFSIRRGGIRF